MLPVDPDVLDADPAAIAGLVHRRHHARIVDRVLLQVALQAATASAAHVEVARVRHQRLDAAIGNPCAGEMRVIERQRQSRHPPHEVGRFLRRRDDRTNMRLRAKNQSGSATLLDAPAEFVRRARQRGIPPLLRKHDAGQRRHVVAPDGIRVFQRAQKPIARLPATTRIGLVDRKRREVRHHLQKHVGGDEPAIAEGLLEFARVGAELLELLRRPQVRALIEQTDVHAAETEVGDEVQRVRMAQQRKSEIGTGEFCFHGFRRSPEKGSGRSSATPRP